MYRRKRKKPNNVLLIFAGQSNTAGRAALADLPSVYRGPQSAEYCVKTWTATGWQPLYPGLNVGDTGGEWGYPSVAPFLVRNSLFQDIYVVESSEGGTSLSVDWSSTGDNYLALEAAANEAIDALGGADNLTTVFIWGQGEADATSSTTSSAYQANLESLIDRFRSNIISCSVIVTGIGYTLPVATYPNADDVRSAQIAVAGFDSPTRTGCYYLDTYRSSISDDLIHKDADGYLLEGEQIAEIIKRIL